MKNGIEPAFVNDKYLLFPLHAYWDKSATVLIKHETVATRRRLGEPGLEEDGGYTPGDAWDLYVNNDNRVDQFVYHRGGPKKPSLVTTTWVRIGDTGIGFLLCNLCVFDVEFLVRIN